MQPEVLARVVRRDTAGGGQGERWAVALQFEPPGSLPGRNGKSPSKPENEKVNGPEEYIVVVTKDTIFQDGSDYIELEDFRPGETVSLHGSLKDNILTATRIAKWM